MLALQRSAGKTFTRLLEDVQLLESVAEGSVNHYPTKYSDIHGSEVTAITNDGSTLRMKLRGVEFSGSDFDDLSPSRDLSPEEARRFPLWRGSLCSCRIECQMPILIQVKGDEAPGSLFITLTLGDPAPNGGLDREDLRVELEYGQNRCISSGASGWFEDELLEIRAQLPQGVFMKCCMNCLYSDYSPLGHGSFGGMMCFRNIKAEYLKVKTKRDFWSVHNRYDRFVQETYLCPEFERRVPGTGYRG